MRPWSWWRSCGPVLVLMGGLAAPATAWPCTPWAGVLAWDMAKDVVAVGIWAERDEPPAAGAANPGFFELRRDLHR